MIPSWILFTLFAAFMQALRTGLQKKLSSHASAMTTTIARYFYAVPLAWIYLLVQAHWHQQPLQMPQVSFFMFATCAATAQILATWLMVRLFQERNFAIGISYAKTEAIMVALLGVTLFGESLNMMGWISVLIGSVGIILLSPMLKMKTGQRSIKDWIMQLLFSRSALLGIASGICFALTSLWVREASLTLEGSPLVSAATTLVSVLTIQWLVSMLYQLWRAPKQINELFRFWPWVLGVGVTSMCGSIGWFTAMTLEHPALVKTLGQVEFFFTLIIALRVFKERFSCAEYCGMAAILLSVVGILSV